MIDQTTLFTYLAILVGFVFLPGPAVLLTLARSMASGSRSGVATGLGIAVGDMFHTLMAVVGVSAVIYASAFLFTLIKFLGAGYLVYLGLRAIFEPTKADLPSAGAGLPARAAFRQGVVAEALNPKSALFFLAFLPQFVEPAAGAVWAQLLILGALFVAMGFVATLVVAIAAGQLGDVLRRNPFVLRWQGKVVGVIYCGLGARLALQEK